MSVHNMASLQLHKFVTVNPQAVAPCHSLNQIGDSKRLGFSNFLEERAAGRGKVHLAGSTANEFN